MGYALSIAHLSDLHFGEHSRFKDKDLKELGEQLAATLSSALKSRFGAERPDIVVTTGDLTEQAAKEEFDQALAFYRSLQKALKLDGSQFVFMPGNHDVSWAECKAYFGADSNKKTATYDADLEAAKFKAFDAFKSSFFGGVSPKMKKLERGAVFYTYPELATCITALNSCEQITDERYLGSVSDEQAEAVMNLLFHREEYKGYIKILAVHHPVNALPKAASRFLEELKSKKRISGDELKRFQADALSIENNDFVDAIIKDCHAHVLLHGHQHSFDDPHPTKWREPVDGYCQICPAGSFGLKPDGVLEDQPSCLNLLHLREENGTLQLRKVFLEYDPLHRPAGKFKFGCFRDTNRDMASAIFPLPSSLRFWSDPDGASSKKTTCLEHVRRLIAEILESNPSFCATMALFLKVTNDAQSVSNTLIEKGFETVWGLVSRSILRFKDFTEELKRVLFLLAQERIKAEKVEEIRKQLQPDNDKAIVMLQTRYALIAELVLKAAVESEIQVSRIKGKTGYVVEPDYLVRFPLEQETGIETSSRKRALMDALKKRFGGLDDLSGLELEERLIGRLRGFALTHTPCFVVHSGKESLAFPYLREFLIPSADFKGAVDKVTTIDEDTLYSLIEIILDMLGKIASRGDA